MYSNNIFEQFGGKTNSDGKTKLLIPLTYTPSDKI